MNETGGNKQEICLLLTATINPRDTILTERNDPAIRLADYIWAMNAWLADRNVNKIVFCENSNSDVSSIRRLFEECERVDRQVELLSFDGQNFDPQLGKGVGEMNIIEYVLNSSKLINENTRLVKVTGRYCSNNFGPLVRQCDGNPSVEIICNLKKSLMVADSRMFLGTVDFFQRFLLPRVGEIRDSEGVYFEHVLAYAIHEAIACGLKWELPKKVIEVWGIEGSTNKPIRKHIIKSTLKRFVHQVKRKLISL